MSLQPQALYCVPEDTARVARAIFPTGNLVMRMYDELGMLFRDADFADVFASQGQPAESPVRLALVTLLQFWEGLTDRQAADAVRTRIDWKYLLCLELTDLGFHHIVLSEFRTRLLSHAAERRLFDAILAIAQEQGLLKAGGRQRSDSTHILGAVRAMTRLEIVTETLRHALNVLATTHPEWLRVHTTADWVDRYGLRASEYRLPKGQAKRDAWAEQVGCDGRTLLAAAYAEPEASELRLEPAIETLRCVWIQNFVTVGETFRWRTNDETPPTGRYIGSPYDVDARYATPSGGLITKGDSPPISGSVITTQSTASECGPRFWQPARSHNLSQSAKTATLKLSGICEGCFDISTSLSANQVMI